MSLLYDISYIIEYITYHETSIINKSIICRHIGRKNMKEEEHG